MNQEISAKSNIAYNFFDSKKNPLNFLNVTSKIENTQKINNQNYLHKFN